MPEGSDEQIEEEDEAEDTDVDDDDEDNEPVGFSEKKENGFDFELTLSPQGCIGGYWT